jgi:hypothetical protein
MVNALKKNFLSLPAGRYGKSTERSTKRSHQSNQGNSGLSAERVQAIGVLRCLRSKKKIAAEKRSEMHFLSNQVKEKWIEDYVESETAGARKQVEDAEAVVQQEQEDMKRGKIAGLMNRELKKTLKEMMVTIGDHL